MLARTLPLLAILLLAAPAWADDAADIQGKWQVLSGMIDGKGVDVTGKTVQITADKVNFQANGEVDGPVPSYKLNPGGNPKQIDLTLTVEGKPLLAGGIYAFNGDRLHICYGLPGQPRPDAFETKPGDKRFLVELKRAP